MKNLFNKMGPQNLQTFQVMIKMCSKKSQVYRNIQDISFFAMVSPLDNMYNNMKLEGQKIIGFGKYYQCAYEDIYMNDYAYCKWCVSVYAKTFSMYDFQQYILKIDKLC